MDIQELLSLAAKQFISGAGSSAQGLDISKVIAALGGLLGNSKGELDLAGLVSQMNGAGLMSLASSWLGDSSNASIGADDVLSLFGQSKVSGFAEQLGLTQPEAVSGLQSALPQLIDKASQGGDLVEGLGSQMLGNAMKGLFG